MGRHDDPSRYLRNIFNATDLLGPQWRAIDTISHWPNINDQMRGLLDIEERLRHSGIPDLQEIARVSPAFQLPDQLQHSFLNIQEQLHQSIARVSPAFQLQDQLQHGIFDMQEQLRQSSAFNIQASLGESPLFRASEELGRGLLGIQEQIRQSVVPSLLQIPGESLAFRLQEQLQKGLTGFEEQFRRSSLFGLENAFKNIATENLLLGISQIQDPIPRFQELAESFAQETFRDEMLHVGPDGAVTLGDETATAAEIEHAFQEFLERLQGSFTDIHEVIQRLQKPIRVLITWVFSRLLIPFLVSLYFHQQASLELREMQKKLELSEIRTRQEVVTAVKNLRASDLMADQSRYRVVTGDYVRIRSRPNRKATVKDRLRRGTVVHFLGKRGRWTAVEYVDSETWFVENGWIFNKYLKQVAWGENDKWDQQIEEDTRTGKLDKLAE